MARILVALGGNALQRSGGDGSWGASVEQMRGTVGALAEVVARGHELILTHGNGPQVGTLLRQNELAERELPARPMHVLGAETQGQIGFLIQEQLSPALERAKVPRVVLTFISRTEVSRRDPAFKHPTKPVGRFYSDAEVRPLRKRTGWSFEFDRARGGWRRLVPSPEPVRWLESGAVRSLLNAGLGTEIVPVVAGGGGVPVVRSPEGRYEGVEAVVDKDLTAALVAQDLGVDTLAIVTDVPGVAIGFGKRWERWLGAVTLAELERLQAQHEFGAGSMGPKVTAATQFLRRGGRRAIITDVPSLGRALRDEAGTRIVPD